MKQNGLVPLARLGSSLSLFGILLCMHMSFTLAHFLPPGSKDAMYAVYIFYFLGIAVGAVLCPLFLPLPAGKKKHPVMGICFISFLIVLEFTLRSLGFRAWLGSAAIRGVMAIPEGILTTTCYGLFYLTWLRQPAASDRVNRTGRFCSLVLGAALLCSVLASYYSIPLMEASLAALDPLKGAVFVFNFIKWSMIILAGVSAAASVFLIQNVADASAPAGGSISGGDMPENNALAAKTDWPVILRLIGFASVFTILNGVMDMRALPLYTDNVIYYPNYLMVAAVVPVLGFLAGRSISLFIRRFLLPAIILSILFSCLPLFEDYPQINVIMSTLIAIAHYTAWVVFTTAIVELYAGGFWYYGIATVIFFSVVFAFLAPIIGPFMPNGTEYRVLFIVIATVLFMLLSFRWLLFPKQRPSIPAEKQQEPFPETSNLEDIFREHELSQREIEVANLLIKEGLGKQEIGDHLNIAPGTAKIHISKIYQKFKVTNRAEFMALFVKGEKI
ncbi:MAG: LuxR C-terminal-related transcriptional regulator [Spirochaetaceae bacterium]|jgi:DNA-binding CsgD family transcriptional regulator|nr:LuxR C-terminal-related transcriptional regulator [Spirochaetaceae bacterium]